MPILLLAVVILAAWSPDSLTTLFLGIMGLVVAAGVAFGIYPTLRIIDGLTTGRKAIGRIIQEQPQRAWLAVLGAENLFHSRRLDARFADYRKMVNHARATGQTVPDISEYFDEDSLRLLTWHGAVSQVPATLTAIGILGTFIGLLLGIHNLEFGDAEKALTSIQDILSGVNIAFYTSIAGIILSVVFNFTNRILQGVEARELGMFTDSFYKYVIPKVQDQETYRRAEESKEMIRLLKSIAENTTTAGNADSPETKWKDQFWLPQMAEGLQKKEFHVYGVPFCRIGTKEKVAIETQTRWNHQTLGLLEEAVYDPVAVRSGYDVRLFRLCLAGAVREIKSRMSTNKRPHPVMVKIPKTAITAGFGAEEVVKAIRDNQISPKYIIAEIPAKLYLTDGLAAKEAEATLSAAGVPITADRADKDTVFAASGVDYIKVRAQDAEQIVFDTAKKNHAEVLVEDVDGADTAAIVKHYGCLAASGAYFGKEGKEIGYAQEKAE